MECNCCHQSGNVGGKHRFPQNPPDVSRTHVTSGWPFLDFFEGKLIHVIRTMTEITSLPTSRFLVKTVFSFSPLPCGVVTIKRTLCAQNLGSGTLLSVFLFRQTRRHRNNVIQRPFLIQYRRCSSQDSPEPTLSVAAIFRIVIFFTLNDVTIKNSAPVIIFQQPTWVCGESGVAVLPGDVIRFKENSKQGGCQITILVFFFFYQSLD